MLQTRLTKDWGLRYPFIGAPMANIARGRLAKAISGAGGLGMIGVKFGIGLMAWVLATRPELLDTAIAQQPFLISISFGDVAPYENRLHAAGIRLASQVNTRGAALRAAGQGADLIVAQGTEAGGHTGPVATLPLLQIVLESVEKPVAAAGGIASACGLAAVLAAGVEAGWIGTAFLLTEEADTTEAARNRIANAAETDTILTSVFDCVNNLAWPPEFPGRALRNAFAERWTGKEAELIVDRDEIARFRRSAEQRDYDVTSIYAGQAVGLVHQVTHARDVVERLGTGAERILRERMQRILS